MLQAAACFFCLLCGYYVLRPLRDEMAIQGGVDNLQWLFLATLVAMLLVVPLFSLVTRNRSRVGIMLLSYGFAVLNLLAFYAAFVTGVDAEWMARLFFVWMSVFNLFVVSLFWSLCVDRFSGSQAKRLFGVIAAGGSVGAMMGPALTATLVGQTGPAQLIPIAACFLLGAMVFAWRLSTGPDTAAGSAAPPSGQPAAGDWWEAIRRVWRSPYLLGIVVYLLFYTGLSTLLYLEQARLMEAALSDPADRTLVFALVDLAVNALTVLAQLFVTARVVLVFGLPLALAAIPLLLLAGLGTLALLPVLPVVLGLQILRRAGNYALSRPAREMLFSVLPPVDRYKSKNFIDTVCYRAGDAASAWLFTLLSGLGLGLSALAAVSMPVALAWAGCGLWLGRQRETLQEQPVRTTGARRSA